MKILLGRDNVNPTNQIIALIWAAYTKCGSLMWEEFFFFLLCLCRFVFCLLLMGKNSYKISKGVLCVHSVRMFGLKTICHVVWPLLSKTDMLLLSDHCCGLF